MNRRRLAIFGLTVAALLLLASQVRVATTWTAGMQGFFVTIGKRQVHFGAIHQPGRWWLQLYPRDPYSTSFDLPYAIGWFDGKPVVQNYRPDGGM